MASEIETLGDKKVEEEKQDVEMKESEEVSAKGAKKGEKSPVTPSERPTRERKTVERFMESMARSLTPKPFSVEKGSGTQLKEIPNVAYKLSKRKPDENLHSLHNILYNKRSKTATLKKNIGLFSGFVWADDEQEKQKTKLKEKLDKCTKDKLFDFCDVLNLQVFKSHKKEEVTEKLLGFLQSPHATTEVLLAEKDQKLKNKKAKSKKRKTPSSTKQSGEKRKRSSKSQEEDNVEEDVGLESEGGDESPEEDDKNTPSKPESDEEETKSDEGGEEEEDKSEDEEEPEPTPKKSSKKSAKKDSGAKTGEKSKTVKKADVTTPTKSNKKSSASASKNASSGKKSEVEKSSKKVETKASAKKESAKEQGKGKTNKKAKAEPTNEEMHAVVVGILKEVDFNTATLSDIIKQLGTHFDQDLLHRKAEVKAIITDVISNMSGDEDEEEEEKEAEPEAEAEGGSDEVKAEAEGGSDEDEDGDNES